MLANCTQEVKVQRITINIINANDHSRRQADVLLAQWTLPSTELDRGHKAMHAHATDTKKTESYIHT